MSYQYNRRITRIPLPMKVRLITAHELPRCVNNWKSKESWYTSSKAKCLVTDDKHTSSLSCPWPFPSVCFGDLGVLEKSTWSHWHIQGNDSTTHKGMRCPCTHATYAGYCWPIHTGHTYSTCLCFEIPNPYYWHTWDERDF